MKRIFTPAKKKSILIVDDDEDPAASHLPGKAEAQGFKVEVARDLTVPRCRPSRKEVVDLLILDLCLPGINVVELIKNIRSDSATQSFPIIAFSNPYLEQPDACRCGSGGNEIRRKSRQHPRNK